jgi:hypothetical protein
MLDGAKKTTFDIARILQGIIFLILSLLHRKSLHFLSRTLTIFNIFKQKEQNDSFTSLLPHITKISTFSFTSTLNSTNFPSIRSPYTSRTFMLLPIFTVRTYTLEPIDNFVSLV